MGSMSIWHWVVVAIIVLLLFGKGRISDMMGDLAKGIKSFKKGLTEEDAPTAAPAAAPQVSQQTAATAGSPAASTKDASPQ